MVTSPTKLALQQQIDSLVCQLNTERESHKHYCAAIKLQMFELGNGLAVQFNPRGKLHGWLFRRHPDGQLVAIRKLGKVEKIAVKELT
jgi:hypothetical protein